MSEFINTADIIGDDELCDQIIMRTVTEYKENRISMVGKSAFYGCTALTAVDVPNATSIASFAFLGCTALASVNAPNVTKAGGVYDETNGVFRDCTSLTSVNLTNLVSMGGGLFYNCTALTHVGLPSVTICQGRIFQGCTNLAVVDLTVVTSILGFYGLYGCTNLKAVILRAGSVVTLGAGNCFQNSSVANGTGYIYVPSALVDTYKAATNWSTYAAQFRALEDYTVDGTITGELDETKI